MIARERLIISIVIILGGWLFSSCDYFVSVSSASDDKLAIELLQYTSSYNEFGSRAEVMDDYIAVKVWYRPDQDKERAERLLNQLVGWAEFKMKYGQRFKARPVTKELIQIEPDALY